MTKEELIEQEACKYGNIDYPMPYGYVGSANDYSNGINSKLAKDLQELAVIDGKIEVLNGLLFHLPNEICVFKQRNMDVEDLETQRTELLTKLNLEG